jgi:hypothetical protein
MRVARRCALRGPDPVIRSKTMATVQTATDLEQKALHAMIPKDLWKRVKRRLLDEETRLRDWLPGVLERELSQPAKK